MGPGLFQSTPNWPFIGFFFGAAVLSALLTALDWRRRRHTRAGLWLRAAFTLSLLMLTGWELSFALVPVREWIRVDLLVSLPWTVAGLAVLAARSCRRRRGSARAE